MARAVVDAVHGKKRTDAELTHDARYASAYCSSWAYFRTSGLLFWRCRCRYTRNILINVVHEVAVPDEVFKLLLDPLVAQIKETIMRIVVIGGSGLIECGHSRVM